MSTDNTIEKTGEQHHSSAGSSESHHHHHGRSGSESHHHHSTSGSGESHRHHHSNSGSSESHRHHSSSGNSHRDRKSRDKERKANSKHRVGIFERRYLPSVKKRKIIAHWLYIFLWVAVIVVFAVLAFVTIFNIQ